jgi:hypothetical protein
MNTSIQIVAAVTLAGVAALPCASGNAQQASDVAGPISKIVTDGYVFSGGTPLGPEQGRSVVAPNKVSYEVKYRLGFAYFAKGTDYLVCQYEIVTTNPIPDQFRLGKPESKCFRIR